MFDHPMNGAEIAAELGITRQDVSQLLKRALVKVYNNVRVLEPQSKPFEVCSLMCEILNVDQTPEELRKFFRLLPRHLKETILADGHNRLPNNPIFITTDTDDNEEDEL